MTPDPEIEKESKDMEYRKVIVNIPKPLLDTFDLVCQMKFYTRKEAVKQSMREFIQTEMGEDWHSPLMQEYEKKLMTDAFEGMAVGFARASQNPEVLEAQKNQDQKKIADKSNS